MKKHARVIYLFFFILIPTLFSGQSGNTFDYHYAHRLIMEHQFSRAEHYLDQFDGPTPDITYLSQLSDFFKIHISEQAVDLKSFTSATDQRLQQLGSQKTPGALFSTAAILLQSSFTRGRYGEYIPAVLQFNKAYKIIITLNKEYPEYAPAQMLHGIILILFGSVPSQYNWLLKLINVRGNVSRGLEKISDVFEANKDNSRFKLLEESLFFLTFSYRNFNPSPDALRKIEGYYASPAINKLITNTPVIRYSAASLKKDLGKNEEAIAYLERSYPQKPEIPFYYLDYYMHGLSLLHRLDYYASKQYFEKYISTYPGNIYKKSAARNIAWIKLITKGESAYRDAIKQVNRFNSGHAGADKAAQREYEANQPPGKALLEVRLLFDGGYYMQALETLLSYKPSKTYRSEKDALEFTYRLGRIYDKLEVHHKAINYYRITIKQAEDKPWYFAANAALQLGKIYLDKGKTKAAREMFEKCLSMNPDTYKDGIHQKAKAFLQQTKS
ncbi:MAG: tetratricopeptide repeat protein [Bacteroidales bacterium]